MEVEVRSNGTLELRIGRPKGGVQTAALNAFREAIKANQSIKVTSPLGSDEIVLTLED